MNDEDMDYKLLRCSKCERLFYTLSLYGNVDNECPYCQPEVEEQQKDEE